MIRIFVICVALTLSGPAAAQQVLTEYYALLSPTDMRNSRGVRLTDLCAIVQQDRANFHRFGLADDIDDWDPIFSSREARAAISGRCVVQRGFQYIPNDLARGIARYVYVRVFGQGGRITQVFVTEGAG
ncbi:hypothetical protein AIOL_002835 [Candidatus Rhodobacter oscarellae]|uniref:Uncharacterized protein n=1 Tax=Candidatus Rhodobacter oscarellae TaxID=1675527 RepID=A0A0J9E554_9RHOB|nr:hypothetical protein [Candidatus Rhodobacter lobularis]KMW57867.1 hypothetical protein AIOL_002835 [Candidatus Rhodobacter lobularis]